MRAMVDCENWKLDFVQLTQEDQEEKGSQWLDAGAFEGGEGKWWAGGQGREEALYAHGPPAGRVWEWAFAPDP